MYGINKNIYNMYYAIVIHIVNNYLFYFVTYNKCYIYSSVNVHHLINVFDE